SVQRQEGDVGRVLLKALHEVGTHVDRDHLVPQPSERVLDPRARAQRHLALRRRSGNETTRPPSSDSVSACCDPRAGGGCSWPVSVPYSATCSWITLPIRRMPSRIESSSWLEKLSRIALRPRPSRYACSPGTNATLSRSARASRSVVSMKSGSVAQMNRPPHGRVHSACGGKNSASASSIVSRRVR